MYTTTQTLLDIVDRSHDWDCGQTWGGDGTRLSQTDTCRICNTERHWFSDRQNGVQDRYTFTDASGHSIPLGDLAARSEESPCVQ